MPRRSASTRSCSESSEYRAVLIWRLRCSKPPGATSQGNRIVNIGSVDKDLWSRLVSGALAVLNERASIKA